LIRRYQERIYATIYHMTANHEDANDLAQETFIKPTRRLKSFQGRFQFFHLGLPALLSTRTINFLKQRKEQDTHEPQTIWISTPSMTADWSRWFLTRPHGGK